MVDHPGFSFDWNLIRTFVAVAEMGSLAKGARSLGITHPTAARHVQLLEEQVGFSLFTRTSHGLALNEAGARMVENAREMHVRALEFQAESDRVRTRPIERIRVTVSEVLAELLSDVILTELDPAEERTVALADIDSARTHFEWGPSPKPGSGKKNKKQQQKQSGKQAKPTTEEERGRP